ncbi:Fur family transcriptional regulator [Dethiobacter alkaliphilus]|uniref:Fur family transcriptional regulator n=1 Tax=Dethiobacter alkaliphilus TaxID=427926 RepID=UPI002226D404|nr:Fur family transcriptional regulator [Dethiobacter alkaliphilus]MCW3490967.1 transcriptional repressor [Dethiobacter alkaliphilus]
MESDILQNRGIKPSFHRLKILEYLLSGKKHPTVDEIYSELVKEVPTLSKTTVYNTLNLFAKAGLVRRINVEEHETRFDANTVSHGHFKCLRCNRIYDFTIDDTAMVTPGLNGFDIEEKKIYFQGTCPGCLGEIKTKKREE